MKSLFKAFLFCLLSVCSLQTFAADIITHDLLLTGGNIIDVKTGSVLTNGVIAVDGNKITFVGSAKEAKGLTAKKTVSVKGKYIIPGLWDMHIHLEGQDLIPDNEALLPLYIAYGITTVRDAASDLGEQVLKWRGEIQDGKRLGPQIYTAGRKLEGIDSLWKRDLEIANEVELNQMLDYLEAEKVDFVKITENTLKGPLFLKSVIAAHKRGFKVSGHVPVGLTIQELAEAGFSSVEHASHFLRLGSDQQAIVNQVKSGAITKAEARAKYNESFTQSRAIAGYQTLAKTGVAVTPTLIGGKQLAYLDINDHKSDAYLDYLTERFTSNYAWRIGRMAGDTPERKQRRKDTYQLIAKQLPHIQKAGILILAGSDSAALNTFVYPALALHEELGLFQGAGLTPLEILQSATINGAKFMGALDTSATLEKGKFADIVVLNSNPLENIHATQDIDGVMNKGSYFNRAALDAMLAKVKKIRNELDSKRAAEAQ